VPIPALAKALVELDDAARVAVQKPEAGAFSRTKNSLTNILGKILS
jgi:hypothetical protein